jgi:hypothetical protein
MGPTPILLFKAFKFISRSGYTWAHNSSPGRKVVTLFQLAAYLGEVDVMKSLIDRVNINIDGEPFPQAQPCINNEIGGEYRRPIDAFIANGNTKVVELLLSKATIKIDLRKSSELV